MPLTFTSLVTNNVECLFTYLFITFIQVSAHIFAHFLVGLSVLVLNCNSSSYIVVSIPFSHLCFTNIFSQSLTYLFIVSTMKDVYVDEV